MTWDERYQKDMIRRIQRTLHRQGKPCARIPAQQVASAIGKIIEADYCLVADGQPRPRLRLAACVLACYQELASGAMTQGQAVELVTDIFASMASTTLRSYAQALLTFSRDPFLALVRAASSESLPNTVEPGNSG